jgi:hypothetical protein
VIDGLVPSNSTVVPGNWVVSIAVVVVPDVDAMVGEVMVISVDPVVVFPSPWHFPHCPS